MPTTPQPPSVISEEAKLEQLRLENWNRLTAENAKLREEVERMKQDAHKIFCPWCQTEYDKGTDPYKAVMEHLNTCLKHPIAQRDSLQSQLSQVKEELKLLKPPQGHGEACYYCKTPCSSVSGNPSQWPIALCHNDGSGVVKWHHIGCVSERLHRLSQWRECAMAFLQFAQFCHARDPQWVEPASAIALYTQLTQSEGKAITVIDDLQARLDRYAIENPTICYQCAKEVPALSHRGENGVDNVAKIP